MKRFLISILMVTSLSILYVFQYAKLLEYSYQVGSYKKYLFLLVDQNRALRYNIAKLEAPGRLEKVMMAKKEAEELYIPPAFYKIKIEEMPGVYQEVAPIKPFINTGKVILDMLSFSSEAGASELNK